MTAKNQSDEFVFIKNLNSGKFNLRENKPKPLRRRAEPSSSSHTEEAVNKQDLYISCIDTLNRIKKRVSLKDAYYLSQSLIQHPSNTESRKKEVKVRRRKVKKTEEDSDMDQKTQEDANSRQKCPKERNNCLTINRKRRVPEEVQRHACSTAMTQKKEKIQKEHQETPTEVCAKVVPKQTQNQLNIEMDWSPADKGAKSPRPSSSPTGKSQNLLNFERNRSPADENHLKNDNQQSVNLGLSPKSVSSGSCPVRKTLNLSAKSPISSPCEKTQSLSLDNSRTKSPIKRTQSKLEIDKNMNNNVLPKQTQNQLSIDMNWSSTSTLAHRSKYACSETQNQNLTVLNKSPNDDMPKRPNILKQATQKNLLSAVKNLSPTVNLFRLSQKTVDQLCAGKNLSPTAASLRDTPNSPRKITPNQLNIDVNQTDNLRNQESQNQLKVVENLSPAKNSTSKLSSPKKIAQLACDRPSLLSNIPCSEMNSYLSKQITNQLNIDMNWSSTSTKRQRTPTKTTQNQMILDVEMSPPAAETHRPRSPIKKTPNQTNPDRNLLPADVFSKTCPLRKDKRNQLNMYLNLCPVANTDKFLESSSPKKTQNQRRKYMKSELVYNPSSSSTKMITKKLKIDMNWSSASVFSKRPCPLRNKTIFGSERVVTSCVDKDDSSSDTEEEIDVAGSQPKTTVLNKVMSTPVMCEAVVDISQCSSVMSAPVMCEAVVDVSQCSSVISAPVMCEAVVDVSQCSPVMCEAVVDVSQCSSVMSTPVMCEPVVDVRQCSSTMEDKKPTPTVSAVPVVRKRRKNNLVRMLVRLASNKNLRTLSKRDLVLVAGLFRKLIKVRPVKTVKKAKVSQAECVSTAVTNQRSTLLQRMVSMLGPKHRLVSNFPTSPL